MDSRRRSIAKALSWRAVATLCTGAIVWALTGQWAAAVSVGSLDVVVKLLLYYAHERAWSGLSYGRAVDALGAGAVDALSSPPGEDPVTAAAPRLAVGS